MRVADGRRTVRVAVTATGALGDDDATSEPLTISPAPSINTRPPPQKKREREKEKGKDGETNTETWHGSRSDDEKSAERSGEKLWLREPARSSIITGNSLASMLALVRRDST